MQCIFSLNTWDAPGRPKALESLRGSCTAEKNAMAEAGMILLLLIFSLKTLNAPGRPNYLLLASARLIFLVYGRAIIRLRVG